MIMPLIPELGYWIPVKDGNPIVSQIYQRHYSCYKYSDNRRQNPYYPQRNLVMGPGKKLILLGYDHKAIFGWRLFKDDSGQVGVNCAFFRNEGTDYGKSSQLILEAESLVINHPRWKNLFDRFYTYIDTKKINSNIPGYCFRRAGWKSAGLTKVNKLLILCKNITTKH